MTIIKVALILVHTALSSMCGMLLVLIDRSFASYFVLSKIWSFGVLKLSGIKITVTGKENIPKNGAYVFVSNHISLYDIPLLHYTAPARIAIVFKKELAKIPFFGWHMLIGPYVVIDRQNAEKAMKSIERARQLMEKRKLSIVIFAEGTRSKTGEVQPFKRGAFYLASRVPFPVVPVSISGTDKILPKGKLKINPGEVKIHFDKPIPPPQNSNKVEEVALMNKVRDIIISNRE